MTISDFSKHLFWDVDPNKLDPEKSKKLIIHRVLDYGLIEDWRIIYKYYGLNTITEVAKNIKDLDKKSASFLALLTDTNKKEFRCYNSEQSVMKFWNS